MHRHTEPGTCNFVATVDEVLPVTGLAYLTDADGAGWAVTKSTKGMAFRDLAVGRQVRLVVERHATFSVVRECSPVTA